MERYGSTSEARSWRWRDDRPRPRAFFYSHDAYGLGHFRTTLALTEELAHRVPGAAQVIATGSPLAEAFTMPPTVDILQLPAVDRSLSFSDIPTAPTLGLTAGGIWSVRAALLEAAVRVLAPDLIHVEHAPAGFMGEMNAALAPWRTAPAASRPALVLGLPDIVDTPAVVQRDWPREGAFTLLDDVYDHILVYGDRRVFDPVTEYGLSPTAAAKVVWCGYLQPAKPSEPAAAVREQFGAAGTPLVVATVGGGQDGMPVLKSTLSALGRSELAGVSALVVTGPLLAEPELRDITRDAAKRPGVTVVPHLPGLVAALAAADVVVTMGGYNTVREAIGVGKRPVIVPRVRRDRPTSEQLLRAERLAALGLATLLHPIDLTPESLARAIRDELDRGFSAPPLLDFGGLDRAGKIMGAALAR